MTGMTGATVRWAWVIAVAGMWVGVPAAASAQEKGIELLGGAGLGFPGESRGWSKNATGAVTWWFSDRWGVAGWYWAVEGPEPRPRSGMEERWFDHMVRPSVRWRTPMYDGRMALHAGFSAVAWTDVFPDPGPGAELRLFPDLVVDVFVSVPVSPSLSVQAGGLCGWRNFLPAVGLAWTF